MEKRRTTDLIKAVVNWDEVTIERLIREGVDVNEPDSEKLTPLYYAIMVPPRSYRTKELVIRALLKAPGINVFKPEGSQRTYLTLLVTCDIEVSTDLIKLFLDNGADLNSIDSDGRTALMEACRTDRFWNGMSLIECGADVNIRDPSGKTALWFFFHHLLWMQWGHPPSYSKECLKLLLDKGADTNIIDNDGTTLLMLTIQDSDYLRILLSKPELREQVNRINNEGKSALVIATSERLYQSAYELVKAGADVNTIVENGRSVFMMALTFFDWVRFITKSIEKGANPNIVDDDGRTSLMLACMYPNHLETITLLIEQGVDVNAVDKNGKTALMLYLSADYIHEFRFRNSIVSIAGELIRNNALVTIVDNSGKSGYDYIETLPPFIREPLLFMINQAKINFVVNVLHMHDKSTDEQPIVPHFHPSAPFRDFNSHLDIPDYILEESLKYLDGTKKKRSLKKSKKTDGRKKRSLKKRSPKKRSNKNKNKKKRSMN